jgi:YVTN family beta-propeller protein
VNYLDASVTVIDAADHRVTATVKVGDHPQAIAVDETANLVYVANTHANTVTVIDGSSHAVVTTLKAGIAPFAIAVDPKLKMLYVANSSGPPFTQIDVRTMSGPVPSK